MTHPSPQNSRIEEAAGTPQARKPGWWERLLLQEDLNFLLTNRVPRIALTRFMGWFSALRSPLLTRLSIAVWRLFTDLDLSEARTDRFNSLQECFTRELRQLWEDHGSPRMPPRPSDTHDALVDARHNRRRFELMTTGRDPGAGPASRFGGIADGEDAG